MENNRNDIDGGISEQQEDHIWITGGDEKISHRNLIDEGAFGEVHHVTAFQFVAKLVAL